jgi:hypothetical protein
VTGATSSGVNRALVGAWPQLTACYQAALPHLSGPAGGEAVLHLDTDGAGTITDVHLTGPLGPFLGRCAIQAVLGRRIANVDTGSASADVPLVFKPR